MRLHLEGLELWDVIKSENVTRKKYGQVMSIFINMIFDKVTHESAVKKRAKKMWNTMEVVGRGVTWICKAWIESLKRDYEISPWTGNLILNFFGKLLCNE